MKPDEPRSFVAAVEFVERIIHEHRHRMGTGKACDDCRSIAINIILGLRRREEGPHAE